MSVSLLRFRAIVYDWDDPEKIKEKMLEYLKDLDLKKENIEIKETKGKGLLSTELIVYELELRKKKHIETFLKNLFKNLSKEEIERIIKSANFDENFSLYLRFDKLDLLNKNKLSVVEHGDVFHLKLSFDIPKKDKEKVLNELKNLIFNSNQTK